MENVCASVIEMVSRIGRKERRQQDVMASQREKGMKVTIKNNLINLTRPFLSVSHTSLGNYCLYDQISESFKLDNC